MRALPLSIYFHTEAGACSTAAIFSVILVAFSIVIAVSANRLAWRTIAAD